MLKNRVKKYRLHKVKIKDLIVLNIKEIHLSSQSPKAQ